MSTLMSTLIVKAPISWWRWLVVILVTLLVGGVVFYFSHSAWPTAVISPATLVFLWAFWLAQRRFKCKTCGGWLKFKDRLGSDATYLACDGCKVPWSVCVS